MGRFNIDDILSQLGAPNAKAPVERVPSPKLAHATVGGETAKQTSTTTPHPSTPRPSAPSVDAQSMAAAEAAAKAEAEAEAAAEAEAEVEDREYGQQVPSAPAPELAPKPAAAPAPVRPSHQDEDLNELWTPDEEHNGQSLDELLVSRAIANPEQIVAAVRIQRIVRARLARNEVGALRRGLTMTLVPFI